MKKMEISIFHISCYRSCTMIWTASICCLEWIWTKTLVLLVQLLKIRSSCTKLLFMKFWDMISSLRAFWMMVMILKALGYHLWVIWVLTWSIWSRFLGMAWFVAFMKFWWILKYDFVLGQVFGVYDDLDIFKSSFRMCLRSDQALVLAGFEIRFWNAWFSWLLA